VLYHWTQRRYACPSVTSCGSIRCWPLGRFPSLSQ
jgi:hypothetical protein